MTFSKSSLAIALGAALTQIFADPELLTGLFSQHK